MSSNVLEWKPNSNSRGETCHPLFGNPIKNVNSTVCRFQCDLNWTTEKDPMYHNVSGASTQRRPQPHHQATAPGPSPSAPAGSLVGKGLWHTWRCLFTTNVGRSGLQTLGSLCWRCTRKCARFSAHEVVFIMLSMPWHRLCAQRVLEYSQVVRCDVFRNVHINGEY